MSTLPSTAPDKPGWHPCWEENVYAKGGQLNRYPFEAVVAFVLSNFGHVADRSAVRILELGFGTGNNLWFAAREGFSVAGIEGSPTALQYARQRFAADGLEGDLREGDFAALPWPDESFDAAIDRMAISQTTTPVIQAALAQTRRVLKPGGKLLSMVYSDRHPDRIFGTHRGQNDYDGFTGGYFAGLGTVHFFERGEIDKLYGPHFTITSLTHTLEEELLGGRRHGKAYWKMECIKEG